MKLFEIIKEIANCVKYGDDVVNVETGEIIDTEALDALKIERDVKIENIGKWILNLEAEEKALADQEHRFKERKEAAKRKKESLKKYIAFVLGGKPWKSTACEFRFRTSEAVVFGGALESVPNEFLRRYETVELDKAKVKKALKAGVHIYGCALEQKQNLTVK